MKVKISNFFYGSIIVQVLSTQGILLFIFFNFFNFWELKSLIHPLSFILIACVFLIRKVKNIKFQSIDVIFFGYLFISFLILVFNVLSLNKIFLTFREIFLVFILIFIFSQIILSIKEWNNILKLFHYLTIINLFFVGLTYYLGPEDYMKLLTGRYFWGIDPEYKFKMSNFSKFWRSPALIGSPGSAGYFGLIVYFFMDRDEKYKKKKWISLMLMILSFVRSAYLVFVIYEGLKFFTKRKNLLRLVLVLKYSLPLLVLAGFYLSKYNLLSTKSIFIRFSHWSNDIDVNFNLLFGGGIGKVGNAVRGSGFKATIDSYWFLLLISIGFIGIFLAVLFIINKRKQDNKFIIMLFSFMIGGVFITYTQGIVFLSLFPLFFLKINKNQSNKLTQNEIK